MSDKGLPWFRMYAEAIDDEKLRLLAFEDRWHFTAIMCCKCAGILDAGDALPLLRRKMAVKLGLAARELDAMADRLAEVGLIDPATFQPVAWEQRQFRSDTDPTATDRKRRQRDRERGVTDVSRVTVTDVTRTDTETDTDQEAETKAKAPRAAPLVLPDWLPVDVWQDWHAYRNSRKGWTHKARALSLRTLTELWTQGQDPRAVVDQAIERGWAGLFPVRQDFARVNGAPQQSKTLTGMHALQGMKSNGLVSERNTRRADEAHVLELGPDACRRLGATHGGNVD